MSKFTSVEICAGAGGQALGLEKAGFEHSALVENDAHACETLNLNRPNWNVFNGDLREFDGTPFKGVDLLAGGVPCPPFSIAGKQLGRDDERDLFPEALRLTKEIRPKAVMFENVRGLSSASFADYRNELLASFGKLGYFTDWRLLNSSDYGVPQLRPRFILVGMLEEYASCFRWPDTISNPPTVSETIYDLISENGWEGAKNWKKKAAGIGPTVVGGSKKHGGPDLGPTRAKRQWAELGVDGKGIANETPPRDLPTDFVPKLTNRMVARIQGFPDDWQFAGKKTATYRQIGNAFPPPVAAAIGKEILAALKKQVASDYGEHLLPPLHRQAA
ncbi:MAG: DNA cytosine methyltransferase [Verrucomicrobiales bacterium]|nr:DNA cytosine methyltransferase [Verrucomicrobiales bacterium]